MTKNKTFSKIWILIIIGILIIGGVLIYQQLQKSAGRRQVMIGDDIIDVQQLQKSTGNKQESIGEVAGLKTFQNKEYKIEFQYPETLDLSSGVVTFPGKSPLFMVTLNFAEITRFHIEAFRDDPELEKELYGSLDESFKQEIIVGGIKGYQFPTKGFQWTNEPRSSLYIWIKSGDTVYTIVGEENFLDQILPTFQFLE